MANFAYITSEFSDFSAIASTFSIKLTNVSRSIDITLVWTCQSLRTSAFQYTQGIDAGDQGSKAYTAVNADINNNSTLSPYIGVTVEIDSFRIDANEYGWTITDQGTTGIPNITLTEVAEVLPAKNFLLTGFSLATSAIPCTNIDLTITENDGVAPYTWVTPSNVSTVLTATISRQATNQSITVVLEDDEGDQASLSNVDIPKLFTGTDISSISVVTNAGGFDATVTAFMVENSLFTHTYSLDGSNFQVSNIFPNVVDGNYTLYVQDGFGCIATQAFTVDTASSISRPNAYYAVPKSNPFRWVLRGVNKYQTLDNTLYRNEEYGQYQPDWFQPYQTNDGVITNQFRSNYDELSARVLDCDDNIIDTLTIEKKSDNIGSQDKRDCIAFNKGNNQTGIYFTVGNIYDPGTTDIIETYELNGKVPDWGVVGNTLTLSGSITGTYVIKQVILDATVQAKILVIDLAWTSGNESESIIAEVTYNKQNYEVYEFDFDCSDYVGIEGIYRAEILMTDSLDEYPALVWDSEYLNLDTYHLNTNVIEYSESQISGIDYSTGFIGKVRVTSLDPSRQSDFGGEIEQYNDSRQEVTIVKASAIYTGIMYLDVMPIGYAEKFNLYFKHFNFWVNGEKFTVTETEDGIKNPQFALKSLNVTVQKNNYEEYQTDNIDVDGDKGTINQESGPILQ